MAVLPGDRMSLYLRRWDRRPVAEAVLLHTYFTFLGFFTMYFFTSSDFLIALFGFISSLAFNNRIENLILMSNDKISGHRGAPTFGGPPIFPYFRGGPWGSASFASKSRRPWLLISRFTHSDVNRLKNLNRLKMSFNRLIIAINRLIAIKNFNRLID